MEVPVEYTAFLEDCKRALVEEMETVTREDSVFVPSDGLSEILMSAAARDDSSFVSGFSGFQADELLLPVEHVQDAGHSLPGLATELMAAQSSQCTEISTRELFLQSLQVDLCKEKETLNLVERKILAAAKSICLAQDEAAEKKQSCTDIDCEIGSLVSSTQELKSQLQRANEDIEEEARLQRQYREKMEMHSTRMKQVEQAFPLQQELEDIKKKIAALKETRSGYLQGDGLQILSGEKQQTLQEEVATVEGEHSALQQQNEEIRKTVQTSQEKIHQLKRDLEMSKKRQQAQVTRLQRQVQEAQSRRRQWVEEKERLRSNIAQLRAKVEK